jgi:hypothetical protein
MRCGMAAGGATEHQQKEKSFEKSSKMNISPRTSSVRSSTSSRPSQQKPKIFILLQPSIDLAWNSNRTPHLEGTIFGDFEKLQAAVIVDWNGRKQGVKHQISLKRNSSDRLVETSTYALIQNINPYDRFFFVGETDRTIEEVQQFCNTWHHDNGLKFVDDFVTYLVTKKQIWKQPVRTIRSDGTVVPSLPKGFQKPLEYVKSKVLQVNEWTIQKPMSPVAYEFNADVLHDRLAISIDPNSIHLPEIEQNQTEIEPEQTAPCLNIVIMIVGSRGDVQPFVALGKALIQYGHRVRLATHENFREFVSKNGLEFYPLAGDPAELMAFMVKNPGLIPKLETIRAGEIKKKRAMMEQILATTFEACVAPDENQQPFLAQAIISNPPTFGHIHCAEKLCIPLHSI